VSFDLLGVDLDDRSANRARAQQGETAENEAGCDSRGDLTRQLRIGFMTPIRVPMGMG